jgi:PAS domain S-box-containing protein
MSLAESEMRHRLIAESATDIISRMGVDGRVLYFSPSVKDVTGYTVEEVTGASLIPIVHRDDIEATLTAYRDLIAGKRLGAPLAYRIRHKDGHWVWLEGSPILIRDPDGAPSEIIDVRRDVSAKVRLETELRKAKEAAEAATAVKAEFMANMSHEIRTPLTSILGFTSLLEERTDLDESARLHLLRIGGAGKSLLALVNNILDFSKLEAGQVEICPEPTAPQALLRDSLLMFTPQAGAKSLALDVSIAAEVPPCLMLDANKVRQILLNLIGNAVKFTDQGAVHLSAGYDEPSRRLRIKVQDTGAGMDKAQQERLFQRFSQVDGSSTRRHGGTGLGLAICKGLAEAMHGDIGVSSWPGRGSVFQVDVYAEVGQFPAMEAAPADLGPMCDLRILFADDNPVNRELVRAILTPYEVALTEVASGQEAIDAANLTPFDVILMDIRMPGVDGPRAARSIRQSDGPNRNVPILAFSADLDLAQFERGVSDFDGVVRKPIVVADLIAGLVASQVGPVVREERLSF